MITPSRIAGMQLPSIEQTLCRYRKYLRFRANVVKNGSCVSLESQVAIRIYLLNV